MKVLRMLSATKCYVWKRSLDMEELEVVHKPNDDAMRPGLAKRTSSHLTSMLAQAPNCLTTLNTQCIIII